MSQIRLPLAFPFTTRWLISTLAQSHFCRAVDIRHSFARGNGSFMAFHTFGVACGGLALTGFMLAVAGCQSGDNGILNLGFGKKDTTAPPPPQDPKILASQLNAYCRA